jgi:hypothetical protein
VGGMITLLPDKNSRQPAAGSRQYVVDAQESGV